MADAKSTPSYYFRAAFSNIFLNILMFLCQVYNVIPRNVGPMNKRGSVLLASACKIASKMSYVPGSKSNLKNTKGLSVLKLLFA